MGSLLSFESKEAKRIAWLSGTCGVASKYLGSTREGWQDVWKGQPAPWPTPLDTWTGQGEEAILAMTGEPGQGKTHAAVTVLTRWARDPEILATLSLDTWGRPNRMIMIRVPYAVRTLQKHYQRKNEGGVIIRGKSAPDFFDDIAQNWDLVIYDDWGSQPDRENWWTQVEGWIDDRDANQAATIVTQNPIGAGRPDARIARRVMDGLVIPMPWKPEKG